LEVLIYCTATGCGMWTVFIGAAASGGRGCAAGFCGLCMRSSVPPIDARARHEVARRTVLPCIHLRLHAGGGQDREKLWLQLSRASTHFANATLPLSLVCTAKKSTPLGLGMAHVW